MDTKKSQEANALLRLKAEEFLKKNPKSNSLFASEEDIMRLLHELEVHQIELQMQNEELYKAIYHAEELAELAAEKYYELYAFSTSGYFTLSADFEIIELNHRGAKMLGKERSNLIGNHFGLFVSKNSLDVFQVFFSNVFKSKVKETCEITLEVKGCKRQYVYVEGFVGEGDKCLLNVVDITQRKLVEQELAYEKNRLADILEGTNVGTWEWNVKTGVTIFNERWAGMLGYTLAEISPTNIDTWIKFTHPDDLEVSNELLNEHFERKTDYYKCEARMKHKDGYWVWVLDRGRVHKWDEDGKPLLMSGTHQDVTERKLVEAELEESREKYRGLSEASFEAIFISEKGKCIEQNLAGEKMFGYTTEEALTRYGTEWIAPEYRDMVMNNMLAGHENPYEAVALKKDGTRFPCVLRGKMMHYKGRDVRVTSLTDISDRKKAEEELVQQTSLITSLLDSIPDIIFFKDLEGVYIGCNPPFAEFVGKDKDAIIGKTDYDLFDKEVADFFKFHDQIMLEKKQATHNEEWITYPDGRKILIDTLKTPYWGADGDLIGVLGISRDITDRKKSEEELKQISTRLSLATHAGGIGVWDLDAVNNKLTWDDYMFKLYGIDKNDFTHAYDSWLTGVHPEDKIQGDAEIQMAISGQKDFDTEFRVVWPDGSIHYIRANAIVVRNESGEALHMIGTNWDITEQKKLEEKLKSSEINFRTFFETIDDMIFIGNQQGKIFYCNDAVIQKLGYSIDELNRMNILDVHPVNRREEAELIFGEMFSGKRDSCPLPLARKNGSLVPVETRVWFGKWDEKDCVFGISKDISKEQEALQKFNKMFENNPASMAVSSFPSLEFTDVNNAFLSTTGYSKAEVIGKTSDELNLFIQPENHHSTAKDLDENGFVQNIDLLLRNKSGDILNGLFSGAIIESQGRKSFLTVMTDITKQKQAEEEMRHLATQLTTLIAHLPGGLLLETPDRYIQHTNQKFCDIFGIPVPPELLIGADCNEASEMSKELFCDSENFILRIIEILSLKVPVLDEELKLKDGRVLQRDYIPVYTSTNEIEHLWHYRDVSEHNKAQIILAKQSALQKILMDISFKYINIPLLDIEVAIAESLKELGRFVEADRAYIFEYDWQKKICTNTFEWCEEGISPQIDDLQSVPLEFLQYWVITHQKGETMNIPDVFALPLDDDVRSILEPQEIKSLIAIPMMNDTDCIGFIGFDSVRKHYNYSEKEEALLTIYSQMLVNVKNRAKLEKNLIEEKRRAEQANATKSEFIANISHEIRTPMNAILGFSEVLYYKLETPHHKQMLKSVLSSGNLLLSLLNDILDLSKIESGKFEITPIPVDFNNLLQEILLLFKDKAQLKGLKISIITSPDFPDVVILDEIRMKQIVFNLVGNALKFTHHGFIIIRASFTNVKENIGQIQLEVEDSGIGIPEAQQQRIFEAFNQLTDQYGGAGLGLPISKRLVEKMNGTISVDSAEGKGSIFKIIIPTVKIGLKKSIKKAEFEDIKQIVFEKASILVVDDVVFNIQTIENMLSDSKLDITTAETGEIALEKLKSTTFDLILLDLRLPGISGYDVANYMKGDANLQNIPIIAYSASNLTSKVNANSVQFDGFLFKPVKKADLFKQLTKFLKYSSAKSLISAKKKANKDFNISNPVLLEKLPLIKEILEEKFIPYWESVKDSFVLYNIETFSVELKELAIEFNFKYLVEYAVKIREDVDTFDLDRLKENLSLFPSIIKKMSEIIKERK